MTIGRDMHCAQCSDRGTVPSARWWDSEADREPCPRAGCVATEELAAQQSERAPCSHIRRVPAMRLPPGCWRCVDCDAVWRQRSERAS